MNRGINRCSAGMTFTEVLVATAILAFAMVPILKAMAGVHMNSSKMEKKNKSLMIAQNQIEQLRARAIADFGSSWSAPNQSSGGGYLYSVSAGSGSSLRTVTVTAGFDENQNLLLDSTEVLASLRTLIAKLQ